MLTLHGIVELLSRLGSGAGGVILLSLAVALVGLVAVAAALWRRRARRAECRALAEVLARDNRTFAEGLVKLHPPEPLEGHEVVVFERVGEAGERFRIILVPGMPLKRRRLGPIRSHRRSFALAVDASPDLHVHVRERVVMDDDEAHQVDLVFDLYYFVADARLLAVHRSRDPLGMLCARARQVIGRDVAQLQWTDVVYAFATCAQEVLRNRLPELQRFAAAYGIALKAVEVGRLLPDDATDPARKTAAELDQISRQERVNLARMESARRIQDTANLHVLGSADMDSAARDARLAERIRAAVADGQVHAIGEMARQVSTPEEYRKLFRGSIHPADTDPPPDAPTLPGPAEPAALAAPGGGLLPLLAEVVFATQNVGNSTLRIELRSALLHLAAEVLLGDRGDATARRRHAHRAGELLASLDPELPPQELDLLRALADPEHIAKALRG